MDDPIQLDWRGLQGAVATQVEAGTGVIHVRLAPGAPQTIFIRILTERWLTEHHSPESLVVVHVEPDDPAVRYMQDLAGRILRSCGIEPGVTDSAREAQVRILDGNQSEHMTVTDTDIRVEINNFNHHSGDGRVETLRARLGGVLATKKLVVVFRDAGDLKEAQRVHLGRELWKGCLARFQYSGVLLVFLYNQTESFDVPDETGFPPAPNVVVDLSDEIGPDNEVDAIEDLVALAISEQWFADDTTARAFADGVVMTTRSMKTLHTRTQVYSARRMRGSGD